MFLNSRIDAAERRVAHARRHVARGVARVGRVVHRRVCSPQALVLAFGAGFTWGLRPGAGDAPDGAAHGGGETRLKSAARFTARAVVTRVLSSLFV